EPTGGGGGAPPGVVAPGEGPCRVGRGQMPCMLRTGNKGVPGPRRELAGDRLLTPARRARPRWSTPTTSAGTVHPAGSMISRTVSGGDSYACDAAFHPGGDGSDRLDDRAGG